MRAQEFLTEMDRRGFLKGLAGFAASAAVPSSVVKLLSTPAGVSSLATSAGVSALGIGAGLALLKGIRAHLDQYRAEDDDAYFEAWEDMAARLGFNATDAKGNYHDPLSDLLKVYRKNPEQAAQQLIKHVQRQSINPADVKSSFTSRADNPSDWRYHARKDREEPELTGGYGDKPTASAQPSVSNVATAPGTLARAATMAKAGIDKLSNLSKLASPAQQGKAAPALSAPTKPEVELPTNVKQKQAEPMKRQGNGQEVEETLEYKHMNPEFAAKAVTLLGLKGNKAYDEIKELAIQMGQVREFRNLMNAANGMAFSEFDTNPGDFKNWWQFARDLFAKFAQ
jgi:hypothetical protein